jgi:glycosyltransferase involved in cell wall biosynthesis
MTQPGDRDEEKVVPWPRVSVVIPALNEARNLPHVFGRITALSYEVIVVDGGSVDDTVPVARRLRPDARIIGQSRTGKGNALACGFVAALLNGADLAKGTRYRRRAGRSAGSDDITRLRSAGNRLLIGAVNLCYGTRFSDLCYGFNAFWRRHVPVFGLDAASPAPGGGARLWGDGFEVEALISIRAARAGLQIAEVPSFEHTRIHGTSNLSAFPDGFRVLRTILAELSPPPARSRAWHPPGAHRPQPGRQPGRETAAKRAAL